MKLKRQMNKKQTQFYIDTSKYSVSLAGNMKNRQACIDLRHKVLKQENIQHEPRRDQELYDQYGRHLMITDRTTGEMIATMRLLSSQIIRFTNGFDAEGRFEMSGLMAEPAAYLELGPLYVSSGYEFTPVLGAIVKELPELTTIQKCRGFFTVVTLPLKGGDNDVQSLMHLLRHSQLTIPSQMVKPRVPLRRSEAEVTDNIILPELLQSYLRLGARVSSEPNWDAELGTADLLLWVDVAGRLNYNSMLPAACLNNNINEQVGRAVN